MREDHALKWENLVHKKDEVPINVPKVKGVQPRDFIISPLVHQSNPTLLLYFQRTTGVLRLLEHQAQ